MELVLTLRSAKPGPTLHSCSSEVTVQVSPGRIVPSARRPYGRQPVPPSMPKVRSIRRCVIEVSEGADIRHSANAPGSGPTTPRFVRAHKPVPQVSRCSNFSLLLLLKLHAPSGSPTPPTHVET